MYSIFLLIISLANFAFSQTIEIRKIKGNKAGVVFDGVHLKPGDFINSDIKVLRVKGNKAIVRINNPGKYHNYQFIDYIGNHGTENTDKREVERKWYINPILGFEMGGDVLVISSSPGGDKSEAKAGDGLLLMIGARYNFSYKSHLQLNFGIKKGDEKYANGQMDKSSIPIELIWYHNDKKNNFRFGGGIAYHMANKLNIEKEGEPNSDIDVKNALGYIISGDYFLGEKKNILLGFRFTVIDYDVEPVFMPGSLQIQSSLDASSFGIVLSYMYGL